MVNVVVVFVAVIVVCFVVVCLFVYCCLFVCCCLFVSLLPCLRERCSSLVRAFANGAMGRRIDPSS